MLHVTNEAGRRFLVRCIRKGDRYGLNGCLLHDGDDPVIEITDVTPPGETGPPAWQSFLARFPARTVLGWGTGGGVWLSGHDEAWRLSPAQVRQVVEWVRRCLGTAC
jgi:hypothetical protein